MGGRAGGFGPDFASSMSDIFDDLFGEFMGGRRGAGQRSRSWRERGADLRYNMEITLDEAFAGKTAQIRVPDERRLRNMHRHRRQARHQADAPAPPAAAPARCAPARASSPSSAPAPPARAAARSSTIRAPRARGAGRVTKERTLSVNIPAGVEDGTRIRLAGEGEAGLRGGPPGDLYIFLSIKPHEFFQRDGADIFCKVPISMTTAALGGQIEVPTLEGSATRVKIPEGTETGKQFRLKGKGMPVLRSKVVGRHVHPGRCRDAQEPDPPAARAAGGVRAREPQGDEPGKLRLLRPREGVLRRQEQLRFNSAHDQLGQAVVFCRQRPGRLV